MKDLADYVKAFELKDVKAAFTHYAAVYPKLVTDAVPAIRASANSLLSSFISTLKKETPPAALKVSLPFLLFSLSDAYGQVIASAESAIEDCFFGEKRKKLFQNFSRATAETSMEIIGKRHKLMQPQKFTEDESNALRQTRLIAQAVKTLDLLMEQDPQNEDLASLVHKEFENNSTLSTLIAMPAGVKVATFMLLRRLVQANAGPFYGTKLPSVVLNNLDSGDIALCRYAFECKFSALRLEC